MSVNDIDIDIFNKITFNIGIIGPVRSGKKTLIKSLFAESYSDKSEFVKYFETDRTIDKTCENAVLIRELNKDQNEKVTTCVEERGFNVPSIPDLFENSIANKIEQRIYSIPSLNSLNKEKLYQYVIDNFYKFDLILFTIDINNGLQTVEEIEMIKLIRACIINTEKYFNKKVKLIVVCNKCDNMIILKNNLTCSSVEQEKLFSNICQILQEINVHALIIKYSGLYSYIYRYVKYSLCKKDPLRYLDETFVDKIGIDNFGKVSWNMISREKAFEIRREMIKPFVFFSHNLNISGYEVFKKVLNMFIIEPKIFKNIIYEKINLNLDIDNVESKLKFLKNYDSIFGTNYSQTKFPFFLEKYLEHINKKTSSKKIKDTFDIPSHKIKDTLTENSSAKRITTVSTGTQSEDILEDAIVIISDYDNMNETKIIMRNTQ